ncbi:acyltransferase family protein [Vineibacter terrae]|nr:acyltransferase [Vineibacter terrae]
MTGLRGVAALLVATYHYYPPNAITQPALSRFIGKGYLWVDVFFILSGFVLALNYAHLFASGWSLRRWRDFLVRRLARIYPLYIVLVLGAVLLTLVAHGNLHPGNPAPAVGLPVPIRDLVANLLMVQSWGITRSINGPAWSISTEWAAYLVFPVLVGVALFSRAGTALIAVLAVVAVILGTVGLTMHDGAYHSGPLDAYDGTTVQPLLRCFGGFVLGLLTYRLSRSPRVVAWAAHDGVLGLVIALLVIGFAAGAHDLVVYPLFAALVLGLYGNRGRISQVLGSFPVYWLGLVSYSLYLLHDYLIGPRNGLFEWLQARVPAVWAHVATVPLLYGALLLVAGLTYYAVEAPGRRLARRLSRA